MSIKSNEARVRDTEPPLPAWAETAGEWVKGDRCVEREYSTANVDIFLHARQSTNGTVTPLRVDIADSCALTDPVEMQRLSVILAHVARLMNAEASR